MRSIYLDAEWYIGGEIFLIGLTTRADRCTMLHGERLNAQEFLSHLRGITHIYFFGPDIGIIERYFHINLRHNYYCINLIKIFRHLHPRMTTRKLIDYERKYRIRRKTRHLKGDVFGLLRLWRTPIGRKLMLQYNAEDVQNLARLKRLVFARHHPTPAWVNAQRLK